MTVNTSDGKKEQHDLSNRYDRQLRVKGWDQEKIKNSTVCVWGVGALGTFVAAELAMMGIGNLILVDFDTIEVSNLNRQLLYREKDVGKSKAEIAAGRILEINSSISIEAFNTSIEEVPMRLYKEVDVFVGALDSFEARRWANSLAVQLKKPLVLGGMYGFLGQVQVIVPFETACFECQPLVPSSKLSQVCTPPGEVRKEKLKIQPNQDPVPGVATMSGIVGSLMAQEVTKLLLKIGTPISYLFIDGLNNSFTEIELARNPSCPLCGEKYQLSQIKLIVEKEEQISSVIERIKLTYGLNDPKIAWKGKLLDKNKTIMDYNIEKGDSLLVIDTAIAKPIKLIAELEELKEKE